MITIVFITVIILAKMLLLSLFAPCLMLTHSVVYIVVLLDMAKEPTPQQGNVMVGEAAPVKKKKNKKLQTIFCILCHRSVSPIVSFVLSVFVIICGGKTNTCSIYR